MICLLGQRGQDGARGSQGAPGDLGDRGEPGPKGVQANITVLGAHGDPGNQGLRLYFSVECSCISLFSFALTVLIKRVWIKLIEGQQVKCPFSFPKEVILEFISYQFKLILLI